MAAPPLPPATAALGVLLYVAVWVSLLRDEWRALPLGRALSAVAGAALFVAAGVLPPAAAFAAVDVPTLALLTGCMLLAAHAEKAGAHAALARMLAAGGSPRALLARVSLVAAGAAALLTNDTACVVLTPLVVAAARGARRAPRPFLVALATASNIGSALSPIGNPQNMIIAVAGGLRFADFLAAIAVAAAIGLVLNGAVVAHVFARELSEEEAAAPAAAPAAGAGGNAAGASLASAAATASTDTGPLVIDVARAPGAAGAGGAGAAGAPPGAPASAVPEAWAPLSGPASAVRDAWAPPVGAPPAGAGAAPAASAAAAPTASAAAAPTASPAASTAAAPAAPPAALPAAPAPGSFRARAVAALLASAPLFLLLADGWIGLAWASLLLAAALCAADGAPPAPLLARVDAPLLLFFAGLFVCTAGLEATGLPAAAWAAAAPHVDLGGGAARVAAFAALVAAGSNTVSNVPLVLLLVPVVGALPAAAARRAFLVLAWTATVGGNLTLLGAVANVIVAERARAAGAGLSFTEFARAGVPSTVLCLAVGTPIVLALA
jgi:Na+/H+ antiporter NhaD/arsenite permease-like protein